MYYDKYGMAGEVIGLPSTKKGSNNYGNDKS